MRKRNWSRHEELLALGVFGPKSRLGDRIEMLLSRGRTFSPRASLGRVAASAVALLGFLIAGSFAPRWIAFAQQEPRPSFEVASIKPGDPSNRQVFLRTRPGGQFTTGNASLKMLVGFAYDVRNHQISGGPNWLNSDKFNIDAKPESDVPIPAGPEGVAKIRLMLQSLLAERFKLAMHQETKQEQVYELVLSKSNLKLKEAADSANSRQQGLRMSKGGITGMAAPISVLAMYLSQLLGRSVIDKTGLTGKYDFTLEYTPDGAQAAAFGPPGPDAPPPPDPNGPSIFTALQEQLGLKLESAKGPVEVLVIDHAEKPDAN